MPDLEIEIESQWFALVNVTIEGSDEETNYYVVEWSTNCRVCKREFTFHTETNIPEGKLRRCCNEHTVPTLRLVT